MHTSQSYVAEAFKAGADAYVLKNTPTEELIEAIRAVCDGRQYISASVDTSNREDRGTTPDTEHHAFATLTPREHEVLLPVVQGKTNGEIARNLDISQRTVEFHRANMMTKLGVRNQTELLRLALQYGLLPMQ
jgi:two-component system response regulator NreC